jgi:HD-GYP domain
MKTAPPFHIYLLGSLEHVGLTEVLSDLGLEGTRLEDATTIVSPALILLGPGQSAPQGLADISIAFPVDASRAALGDLLHMAMENVALKQEVRQLVEQARRQHRQFEELNRIGIALSAERDIGKLQEFILTTMRQLTNADGASLWLKTVGEDGQPKLFLASSQNTSIDNTYQAFKVPVDEKSVVGYTVTVGTSQIYDDAYNPPPGKPQGGKGFDQQYGYRTKSMLTVPMRNYNNEVVGAVQLINAKRSFDTRLTVANVPEEVVSFRPEDLEMIESIASQAAVAIDNKNLLDSIQALFDGFVEASVTAIEQRDPSTAGHSGRVEALTTSLANAVTKIDVGKYRDVYLSDDQLKELRYACLLHDFGKVGVREHILIKAKKLMPGQLEVIQARFEFVERSVQVKYATEKLEAMRSGNAGAAVLAEIDRRLEEDLAHRRQRAERPARGQSLDARVPLSADLLRHGRKTAHDARSAGVPLPEHQEGNARPPGAPRDGVACHPQLPFLEQDPLDPADARGTGDRLRAPREAGRHGLPARAVRRPDPHPGPHDDHLGHLRRAHRPGSSLQTRSAGREGDRHPEGRSRRGQARQRASRRLHRKTRL